jgi:Flp pilus assembly pilin Flp
MLRKTSNFQFGRGKMRKSGDRRGATFLEYALLAALVGIVGAVGVMKYGKAISDFFSSLGDKTAEVTPKK